MSPTELNPFVAYDAGLMGGYRYHPFIDYTGVHVHPGGRYVRLDYFGFCNREDLYFREKDYLLVVLTGGSEAAGYAHRTTIAEHLERILNERSGQRFRVLSLAMDSYVVSNEINSYVHLAYHLKPEFVITHSGWNDVLYGMMVPYNFKRLGLNYLKLVELWLPRLYELKKHPAEEEGRPWELFDEYGSQLVVDRYLQNLEKFGRIVHTNGGRFLVGVQPYDREKVVKKRIEQKFGRGYDTVMSHYDELLRKARERGYITFEKDSGIRFYDHIHTTDESSGIIAARYAKEILAWVREN